MLKKGGVGAYQESTILKKFLIAKTGTSWTKNYIMLIVDYEPQNQINIHESIFMDINNKLSI